MAEVDELAVWAKTSLKAIQAPGAQVVFTDNDQNLLVHPDFGPTIRGLGNSIFKQNPPGGKGQGASEG